MFVIYNIVKSKLNSRGGNMAIEVFNRYEHCILFKR